MSDGMTSAHDAFLDDVAVYALGTMNAADAARVRAHLETCAECQAEYQALAGTVVALATTAQTQVPGELLKARIMREIRTSAPAPAATIAVEAPRRTRVWPAYLLAAACFAAAVLLSIQNLTLVQRVKSAQTQVATLADLMDASARRYDVGNTEVVKVHDRVYITMRNLTAPPNGKVYQAWTLPKGGKLMVPSLTFVPDARGVAVVSLPVEAAQTAAVAVSVEPGGGSKQPTSKPVFVQVLD